MRIAHMDINKNSGWKFADCSPLEFVYCKGANDHVIFFKASRDGKELTCAIRRNALWDYFETKDSDLDKLRAYQANKKIIYEIAEKIIKAQKLDEKNKDNVCLITTELAKVFGSCID